MSIDRSSDSLSRCDPSLYSSLYDVRKRPDVKSPAASKKPVEPSTGTSDTIEATLSKEHLKKEALQRLHRPAKYMIAQQGFMRVGKYLFLPLILPPYLLLYGLPKWILVEALPALISPLLKMVKTMGTKIKKPVQIIHKSAVQFMQTLHNIGMGLIQPVIRLMSDMRLTIRRLQQRVNLFFKRTRTGVRTALLLPGIKIKAGFKQIHRKAAEWAKKIARTSQTWAEKVQGGLQTVKEAPLQFLGWGQAQLQRFHAQTLIWKNAWGQRLQHSQRLTEQTMGWIAKQSHSFTQKMAAPLRPLITFYRERWQPRWNRLKQAFHRKWKEGGEAFHQKHKKMLQRLKERQEKLKRLSYLPAMERLFSKGGFSRLPRLLQEGLKKCLFHPLMRRAGERCIQLYSWMAGQLFALPARCSSFALRSMQMLSRSVRSMTSVLTSGGQKGKRMVQLGLQKGGRQVWFSAYYLLLSLTMGGVLFGWAMELARTITRSLLKKFSFKS